MANDTSARPRRGAPKKPIHKRRQNITIHPDVLTKGRRLAHEEGRSFSSYLEQLILRAHQSETARA